MKRLLIGFLCAISLTSQAQILRGVAKNSKGEVLYLEIHEILKDEQGFNSEVLVSYSKPTGPLFASMRSDFKKSRLIPETIFEDTRFGRKIQLRIVEQEVVFEEFKDEKLVRSKKHPLNEDMVAGQGFDNYLRLHFQDLKRRAKSFRFGVLDKQEFYQLAGYQKGTPQTGKVEFGIRADSWLLRLFANELSVVYDEKTLRLISFSGRSNISDDKGNSQDVSITYHWEDAP